MRYKLVVTDMDGTLLKNHRGISDVNREAIEFIINQGAKLVLATGRMYDSAEKHIEFLNEQIPIIACNGSLIKLTEGKVIYSNSLDISKCSRIIEILEKYDLYYQCQNEKTLFCTPVNYGSSYYSLNKFMKTQTNVVEIDNFGNLVLNNEILKFTIIEEDTNKLLELKKELKNIKGINITSSWENNIEIMNKNVDKGEALKFLCNYMNIDRNEVIAFGDNYNDIEMLKFAGLGVVMGNAHDDIKKIGDYVTQSNDDDGFAKAIYKHIKLYKREAYSL